MSSALSEELQKEHGIQSLPIRRDDVVAITRGSNKGATGKVKNVYRKRWCLYVEKIQRQTKKGALVQIPINPSNVKITKLVLTEDRKALIQRKRAGRGLDKGKYTKQEVSN